MSLEHIKEHKDESIREVLAELGGWPVITPNWVVPNFSVEHLLGKIRGIYNEGYIIDQWVGPDDKNSSVNIIQVNLIFSSIKYFLKPTVVSNNSQFITNIESDFFIYEWISIIF